MTLRRASAVTVLSVVLGLTAACGSDAEQGAASDRTGAASPRDAVERLLSAMEEGDCTAVRAVVVTPDAVDCETVGTLRGGYADEGVDLDDATFTTGEQSGGSAEVVVDLGADADDETWQVEDVDGRWKVLFDSEA